MDITGIMDINEEVSEDFIREIKDQFYWQEISQFQKLSESFIREFKDKCNWPLICIYQTLSESFIKEFAYSVCWPNILRYQQLSEIFIRESLIKYNILYTEYKYNFGSVCSRETRSKSTAPNLKIFSNIIKNKENKYFSTSFIKEFAPHFNEFYIYNHYANKIAEAWLRYIYKPGNIGYTNALTKFENEFV